MPGLRRGGKPNGDSRIRPSARLSLREERAVFRDAAVVEPTVERIRASVASRSHATDARKKVKSIPRPLVDRIPGWKTAETGVASPRPGCENSHRHCARCHPRSRWQPSAAANDAVFCDGFRRDSARNPPELVIIADLDARLKVAPPSRYFGHVCVRCVSRCHEQTVDGLLKNTLETIWRPDLIYSAEGDFFFRLIFEQYGW